METQRALDERRLGLDVLRVGQAALDGADGLTCLARVEADALRAEARVDHVDLRALLDGLVGAFGFAHIAIDAFVGDHQGHVRIITAGPVFPAGTGADTLL